MQPSLAERPEEIARRRKAQAFGEQLERIKAKRLEAIRDLFAIDNGRSLDHIIDCFVHNLPQTVWDGEDSEPTTNSPAAPKILRYLELLRAELDAIIADESETLHLSVATRLDPRGKDGPFPLVHQALTEYVNIREEI